MSLHRRSLLLGGTAGLALGAAALLFRPGAAVTHAAEGAFEIVRTEAEWRAMLTEFEYYVLREQGTEPPYSSPLNDEHRPGIFSCKGCDLPLFDAATKFDSGTGWPSFYQPLENAVGEGPDTSHGMVRTEAHCRRCGSHLGHVFTDGPPPTGLRYCMDGVSLKFTPAAA